jgi:hypothetical protein
MVSSRLSAPLFALPRELEGLSIPALLAALTSKGKIVKAVIATLKVDLALCLCSCSSHGGI